MLQWISNMECWVQSHILTKSGQEFYDIKVWKLDKFNTTSLLWGIGSLEYFSHFVSSRSTGRDLKKHWHRKEMTNKSDD